MKLETAITLEKEFKYSRREKDSGETKVQIDNYFGICETLFPAVGIILLSSYTLAKLADLYKAF